MFHYSVEFIAIDAETKATMYHKNSDILDQESRETTLFIGVCVMT